MGVELSAASVRRECLAACHTPPRDIEQHLTGRPGDACRIEANALPEFAEQVCAVRIVDQIADVFGEYETDAPAGGVSRQ
jgi:hypothetical protein